MPDRTVDDGTAPDEQPPLGEEWDTDWPDEMGSQQRVEAVADTLRQPRSAQWVAARADVSPKTARKYLERAVDRGELVTEHPDGTAATLYAPDPERKMLDHVIELADRSQADLTDLRLAVADDIEAWQEEFGVESPTDLRLTIDESLAADERRRRKRLARRWESREHLQSLVEVAMTFRDHRERFAGATDVEGQGPDLGRTANQ